MAGGTERVGDGRRQGSASPEAESDSQRLAHRAVLLVSSGTALAALAILLGLVAVNASVGGGATTTATAWTVTLVVCAVLMGVLCVVQGRLWQRAFRRWNSGASTPGLERFSWWVHVASYPVVVVGLFAGVSASHDVGFLGRVSTFATLALVPLIGAQVVGAVQHVRTDGPPGTIPTHVRRLSARIERSRHED